MGKQKFVNRTTTNTRPTGGGGVAPPSAIALETAAAPQAPPSPPPPLSVAFIHLDLGIGGAEQLILQLATASKKIGYSVHLYTTRCDDDHCFAAVSKSQNGPLSNAVKIYGGWIPATLLGGVAKAFMSTWRMCYVTWEVCRNHRFHDVIVVDVLPTSIPLLWALLPSSAILFYCHFPDKLLLSKSSNTTTPSTTSPSTFMESLKDFYRWCLDGLEERTMGWADLIVVNSQFTRNTVRKTFPRLPSDMPVLYPALEEDEEENDTGTASQSNSSPSFSPKTSTSPIVSLNRFERKKNIPLLIHAYHYLYETYCKKQNNKDSTTTILPRLIIAGGYDTQNVENVQHRGELQQLIQGLGIAEYVDFRMDISDVDRATLLQTALCVVYTPHNEHFGIVPLEAMYAATPVLAVNSGGPLETIVHEQTGFLCPPYPMDFANALWKWISNPELATTMGQQGRLHVQAKFGTRRLESEWKDLIHQTLQRRDVHRPHYKLWGNVGIYLVDSIFLTVAILVMTLLLRRLGVLQPHETLMDGVLRTWNSEEL